MFFLQKKILTEIFVHKAECHRADYALDVLDDLGIPVWGEAVLRQSSPRLRALVEIYVAGGNERNVRSWRWRPISEQRGTKNQQRGA